MTTDNGRSAQGPREMSDEVALLVRLAGTSGPIAAERLARVRTAVYGAWKEDYVARQARQVKTRRRRLIGAVLFAAAASVVLAVAIWRPSRTPAPALVAHIDHVSEQAARSPGPFTAGDAVTSGSPVTTSVGTLAMTLTSGVHLRLDAASSARLDSATDVWLERGAVYVDSAGAHSTQPISIHTPGGALVRDIGTQFEVRLAGDGLRIRVRDGEVLVTYANGVNARVGAGEELFSRPDGSDRSISPAAPPFSLDRKTLGAFLDWVSREGAWTVTFADSTLSARARAIKLSGRPDLLRGLTLAEALEVVLPTCGLRYRIDGDHRVVIEWETSK